MKRFAPLVIAVALAATLAADAAQAGGSPRRMAMQAWYYSASTPWHGGYYHPAWGSPVALVVSPKAEYQTHWGWGVGNTRVTTIWHQFQRDYPGPGYNGSQGFRPTPHWPSDTDQFGVYYVRGPW